LYEQIIKVSLSLNPKERPNFAKLTERIVTYLDGPEWMDVVGETSDARSVSGPPSHLYPLPHF